MHEVFVRHARQDEHAVARIAGELFDRGIPLSLHATWDREIDAGLRHGASLLLCLSQSLLQDDPTLDASLTRVASLVGPRPGGPPWLVVAWLDEPPADPISRWIDAAPQARLTSDLQAAADDIATTVSPLVATIRDLTKLLHDPSARQRVRAADGLGKLGAAAHHAIPAIGQALHDRNEVVRAAAADALARVGADPDAVRALLAIVSQPEAFSLSAPHARTALECLATTCADTLAEALEHPDHRVRLAAARALAATPTTSAIDRLQTPPEHADLKDRALVVIRSITQRNPAEANGQLPPDP